MTEAPALTSAQVMIQETIVEMLPNDPTEALWTLASIIDGCLHAIGEDLPTFNERVIAYARARS